VTVNTLDHVSAHLKLKDNSGGECHSGGVQFRERDRLITTLSQPIQQPLLLNIKDIHRSDCRAAASLQRRRPPLPVRRFEPVEGPQTRRKGFKGGAGANSARARAGRARLLGRR
jgi:hypothetical protein